jgi:hypothetical protein
MANETRDEPETKLAKAFLPWFKDMTGYDERIDDIDTSSSDPVDSAGYQGSDTLLIELKNDVNAGSIIYKGSKGSSIEKKICTALRHLYQEPNSRLGKALRDWYSGREPIFMLVANSYSLNAKSQLKDLLSKRSLAWRFGYEVLEWTGTTTKSHIKKLPSDVSIGELGSIKFPNMPNTARPRSKGMSDTDCQEKAMEKGLGMVLDAFRRKLIENGAVRKAHKHDINYSFPNRNHGDRKAVLAIWPGYFDRSKGIHIAYHKKRLRDCFDIANEIDLGRDVPGQLAPKVGHLDGERYLATVNDVELFWAFLGNRSDAEPG